MIGGTFYREIPIIDTSSCAGMSKRELWQFALVSWKLE